MSNPLYADCLISIFRYKEGPFPTNSEWVSLKQEWDRLIERGIKEPPKRCSLHIIIRMQIPNVWWDIVYKITKTEVKTNFVGEQLGAAKYFQKLSSNIGDAGWNAEFWVASYPSAWEPEIKTSIVLKNIKTGRTQPMLFECKIPPIINKDSYSIYSGLSDQCYPHEKISI